MSHELAGSEDSEAPSARVERPVVVGIGASAGGLDAISRFLSGIPEGAGMAFVIIQHLDPTHKSALTDILSRRTELPILEVKEDTEVQADHIYVIPPGQYLSIRNDILTLSEPQDPRGSRMAIDYFLSSLADDACEFAVGVVLSGTGNDGTAGLQEVKRYGGLTVVQNPQEAEHSGMPQSAIDAVPIDYVLPAAEIGPRLQRYVEFSRAHGPLSAQSIAIAQTSDLSPILEVLRKHVQHDFRRYRKNTLMRRIQRRMSLHQLTELSDYLALLSDNAEERDALRCDLLIGVTRFFRNPDAWALLEEKVILPMMSPERRTPVRVWCAGCATGEEAYSIAMLLTEHADGLPRQRPFQIFATDVADEALAYARKGLYPEAIMKDVSLARLRRFFKKERHGYRVSTALRESVVFAKQNVLAQPPFANLDLILCRNLLIYLEREAQDRVVSVFQFALNDGGVLFQGSSETVGASNDLFTPISKKHRIYRRNAVRAWPPVTANHAHEDYEPDIQPLPEFVARERSVQRGRHHRGGIAATVQRELLQQLGHGVIVVNRDSRVLFADGDADSYVQFGLGELSAELPDLMEIARKGVKAKLRSGLRRIWDGEASLALNARVNRDDSFQPCQLRLSRLPGRPDNDPAAMIIFTPIEEPVRDVASSSESPPVKNLSSSDLQTRVAAEQSLLEVEQELSITREQLNSSITDLESANEDLKAANEEAMTMNEELQSSNEELETSKEELQSLNEELTTLNAQLETKVGELQETTNDLKNLLASSEVPTVFLDTQFCIRRYTPSCTELFRFISGDVGRPLQDINPYFDDPDLLSDAEAVLNDLQPRARQVSALDGTRQYQRRMLPYRTEDNRIQGVVMTLTDITDLLEAQEQAHRQLLENQVIYATSPVGLAFLDTELRYLRANTHVAELNGTSVENHLGKTVDEVLPAELAQQVRSYCEQVIRSGEGIYDLEIIGKTTASEDDRVYLVSYVPVANDATEVIGVNVVVRDITDRTRREANLAFLADLQSRFNLLHSVDALFDLSCQSAATHLRLTHCSIMEVNAQGSVATVVREHRAEGETALFGEYAIADLYSEDERHALRRGELVAVNDTQSDIPNPDRRARYAALGIGAFCAVAFVRGGRIRFIFTGHRALRHQWRPDEIQLLTDVTERLGVSVTRTRTEKSLSDAKVRLDLSLDVGNIALWNWEVGDQPVQPNPPLMKIFGFDEQARPTLAEMLDRIQPEAKGRVARAIDRSLKLGEDYDEEYPLVLPGGEMRYLRVRGALRSPEVGHAHSFFGVVIDITDRKRDELELADREARLRRVIDNTMNYIGELDTDGRLLEVNRVALESGGLAREEVIGKAFWECAWWTFDDDVVERLKNAVLEVRAGKTIRYDTEVRIADGSSKMVDFSLCPVVDGDGRVTHIIASGVDVTEKYAAQMALQEQEKLLRFALRSGGMAAWEWNLENPRWEVELHALLGLSPDAELDLQRFFQMVYPDDVSVLKEVCVEALKVDNNFHHEFRIVTPENEVRWLVSTGTVATNELGELVSVVGLSWDITDAKASEAELNLSKERMEIAAGAAGFANFHVDLDSGKVYWSEQMKVLTGLQDEEDFSPRVGEVPDFVHVDDRERVKGFMERVFGDLETSDHSIEHRIVRPSGAIRYVRMQSRTLIEGSGRDKRISAIVGTLLDVTLQREYERNLEAERLRAQASSESKSQFVANMSHEIRTPMTAVLGCADLLFAMEEDPVKLGHLKAIRRNGDFLLDIINDILDLSKIDAGKLDISVERFRPHRLVADVLSMMHVRAVERGITLSLVYDGLIPDYIHNDPRRLKQILVNLIGNGIKFTKAGGVTLTIRYVDSPADRLYFDVTDTGIGIAKEQRTKLFQPFTQGDQSVSREYEGSGLGLAICRRLLSMLDGDISLSSELGHGSTFSFFIPTGNDGNVSLIEPDPSFVAPVSQEQMDDAIRLDCNVLAVDDRSDIRQLANQFLVNAGATVAQSEDGRGALRYVTQALAGEHALPDLILLDMHMPRLDGYQTATKLRALGYTNPIIALTAAAMGGDRERCLQAGCNGYLSKPINPSELLRTVEKLTRLKTSGGRHFSRVLIAEDVRDVAEAVRRLLESKGISSVVAHSGGQAIDKAMDFLPEAAFIDLSLPDITGFQVLAALKTRPQFAATRFIALTGHTQEKDIERCLEAGFDHHLAKPVDVEQLFAVLRTD